MNGPGLMTAVPGRAVHRGRAGVLGTVALAAGTLSHVAGGGRLPGVAAMLVLLGASAWLAGCFLRRRGTGLRLALLVAAGQTLTHGVLSALAGHDPADSATGSTARAVPSTLPAPAEAERTGGNLHDLYQSQVPTPASGSSDSLGHYLQHQVDHLTEQGGLMVLTHLLGAVALGLFLAVGERALWSMLHLAVARRVVLLAAGRAVRQAVAVRAGVRLQPRPVAVAAPDSAGSQLLDRTAHRWRGPPFLLAA